MLKKWFLLVVVLVSGLAMATTDSITPTGKDWVPWPWSVRQPFPWDEIQGVWKTVDDEFPSYFVMKTINSGSAQRQMQVRIIDAKSCNVLATGVGIETDRRRNLRAQVSGSSGAFFIAFTALSAEDARREPGGASRKVPRETGKSRVVWASIRNLETGKVSQLRIEKVTEPSEVENCEGFGRSN